MIRTYYSNSFEVLRGILLTRLNFEIEDLRNSGASIFETIPVIVPSSLVGDSLERSIAGIISASSPASMSPHRELALRKAVLFALQRGHIRSDGLAAV